MTQRAHVCLKQCFAVTQRNQTGCKPDKAKAAKPGLHNVVNSGQMTRLQEATAEVCRNIGEVMTQYFRHSVLAALEYSREALHNEGYVTLGRVDSSDNHVRATKAEGERRILLR